MHERISCAKFVLVSLIALLMFLSCFIREEGKRGSGLMARSNQGFTTERFSTSLE